LQKIENIFEGMFERQCAHGATQHRENFVSHQTPAEVKLDFSLENEGDGQQKKLVNFTTTA
jgi:hypothetical protein